MMQITNQKRLAARLLGCGVHRVWINPSYVDQISSAVQTDDIREFIEEGWIKAKPIKGTSRVRARARLLQKRKGRRKGQGKRAGTANARNPRKNRWMRTIRSQRRVLKEMREDGTLLSSQYRRYYLKAKGGSYRSIAHLRSQMTIEGVTLSGGVE
ncbi:MAG: 50S ribosomal protein L19e [Euryarchaeota archaeon]